MNKKYKTSVRRAATLLVQMDSALDYTCTMAEDALVKAEIEEVIQWLVDRDARKTRLIKRLR